MLCERSSAIALFVERPICSSFEMYAVLILFFLFIYSKKMCKSHFQLLRERIIVVATFPEHPAYSNFEMFSVLILGLLFWFVVTYPKSMCKSNLFFVNLGALRRKKKILPHSWTTLYIAISKCIVCWFYFFYFDFPLFTKNACMKVIYS